MVIAHTEPAEGFFSRFGKKLHRSHTCLSSAAFQNLHNLTRTMAKPNYCKTPFTLNVTLRVRIASARMSLQINIYCAFAFCLCSSVSVYYSCNSLQFSSTVMLTNFFSEVLQTSFFLCSFSPPGQHKIFIPSHLKLPTFSFQDLIPHLSADC